MKKASTILILVHSIAIAIFVVILYFSASNPSSPLVQSFIRQFEERTGDLIPAGYVCQVFMSVAVTFTIIIFITSAASAVVFSKGKPYLAYGVIITILFLGLNLGTLGGILYLVWYNQEKNKQGVFSKVITNPEVKVVKEEVGSEEIIDVESNISGEEAPDYSAPDTGDSGDAPGGADI